MIIKANIHNFLFILLSFLAISCGKDDESVQNSCFPKSTINVQINTSLAGYQNLNQNGGWIYYNGELAGTKGLIIVNAGSAGYKAYDRNAPHICPTDNSRLKVESDFLIVCPEDGAQWILTTGQPTAVADRAPVQYFTSRNGNILSITSN